MSLTKATKRAYRLGELVFSVKNCNDDFEDQLDKLIPRAPDSVKDEDIYEVKMGCTKDIRELLNHILKRHYKHLWFDAACLVSPEGKLVLLTGKSHSGKSTTSMALALGYGWRVLGEDLTLINPETDQVICFASPFSLKLGTYDLLKNSIGVSTDSVILGEWLPVGISTAETNFNAKFDLAIHLELAQKTDPLQKSRITPSEYLRKILPYSNVFRKPDGTDKFIEYIGSDASWLVSGGTVTERLRTIYELCGEEPRIPIPAESHRIAGNERQASKSPKISGNPKRNHDLQSKLLPDGFLLLRREATNEANTLNPFGAMVWEFCDGTNSVDQIANELAKLAELPLDIELRNNIDRMLKELHEADFVVFGGET